MPMNSHYSYQYTSYTNIIAKSEIKKKEPKEILIFP